MNINHTETNYQPYSKKVKKKQYNDFFKNNIKDIKNTWKIK